MPCRNTTYYIVNATNNNVFVVTGFFFQHLTLGNLQAARYLLYHLVMLNI